MSVSGTALAASFSFSTPADATDTAGEPVSASASFVTGTDSLTITLTNLEANQKSAGQLLSDLFFTLNNVTSGGTLSSSNANTIFVASDGSTSPGPQNTSTGWVFSVSGGVFHLDGLNGADNVPAYLIIGPPDGSGNYSNANSSIAGNGPHNPFVDQTAAFVLSISGINSDTIVTGATFSFGTTPGDNVPGGGVPDSGSTVMLLGTALGSVEILRRLALKKHSTKV